MRRSLCTSVCCGNAARCAVVQVAQLKVNKRRAVAERLIWQRCPTRIKMNGRGKEGACSALDIFGGSRHRWRSVNAGGRER